MGGHLWVPLTTVGTSSPAGLPIPPYPTASLLIPIPLPDLFSSPTQLHLPLTPTLSAGDLATPPPPYALAYARERDHLLLLDADRITLAGDSHHRLLSPVHSCKCARERKREAQPRAAISSSLPSIFFPLPAVAHAPVEGVAEDRAGYHFTGSDSEGKSRQIVGAT